MVVEDAAPTVTSQLSPAPLSTASSQRHVSGNCCCEPTTDHTSEKRPST